MQNTLKSPLRRALLLLALSLAPLPSTQAANDVAAGDGQRDFDWEIGTWKTHVRRLTKPLSGSGEWVEYTGTSVVRSLLDGRANVVELRVQGPAGRIEGASLRLYNSQARQWSLNYASASNGLLTRPVYGGFRDGRGEFFGQDDLDGRAILVRFFISDITAGSARFEQAYSQDSGRTWETNWIAIDTRTEGSASPARGGTPRTDTSGIARVMHVAGVDASIDSRLRDAAAVD